MVGITNKKIRFSFIAKPKFRRSVVILERSQRDLIITRKWLHITFYHGEKAYCFRWDFHNLHNIYFSFIITPDTLISGGFIMRYILLEINDRRSGSATWEGVGRWPDLLEQIVLSKSRKINDGWNDMQESTTSPPSPLSNPQSWQLALLSHSKHSLLCGQNKRLLHLLGVLGLICCLVRRVWEQTVQTPFFIHILAKCLLQQVQRLSPMNLVLPSAQEKARSDCWERCNSLMSGGQPHTSITRWNTPLPSCRVCSIRLKNGVLNLNPPNGDRRKGTPIVDLNQ